MLRWCIAALVFLTALALAQNDESPTVTPLSVWTWQPSAPDLAEDYGIENPQVPVTVRRFSSGAELYQALMGALKLGGAGAPDVIRAEYAFLPLLRNVNSLRSLEDELPLETRARFSAWALKQTSDTDGLYAVPTDASPVLMVYRADLLEANGWSLPTTWAQMTALAPKVTKKFRGKTKLFNLDPNSSPWLLALMASSGAQPWTTGKSGYTQRLDAPAAKTLVGSLQALLRAGALGRHTTGSLEQFRALRDGELLMSAMPLSAVVSLARVLRSPGAARYRVTTLPGGGVTDWGGSSCAVTVYSPHPEAAAQYCLWLATSSTARGKSWQRDGLWPVTVGAAVTAHPALNAFYGGQKFTDGLNRAVLNIKTQTWAPWLPLTDAVYRKVMTLVLNDDLTLTQGLTRWQATVLFEARKAGFTVK